MIDKIEGDRVICYGMAFQVLKSFPYSEAGVKDANAYMAENIDAAVIGVHEEVIYLANKDDKGERVANH